MSFGRTAGDGNQARFLLAVQLASRPGRGEWRPQASSTNRLRTLATVAAYQKRTGCLTVPNSFIRLEQRQRPLDGADHSLPVGNLRRERSDSVSDFILDGSHVWILPHRKIIPKYGCLLNSYKSIWKRY